MEEASTLSYPPRFSFSLFGRNYHFFRSLKILLMVTHHHLEIITVYAQCFNHWSNLYMVAELQYIMQLSQANIPKFERTKEKRNEQINKT